MESLETAALFVDNLLDFSSDIGEDDYDDADNMKKNQTLCLNNHQTNNSADTTFPDSDSLPPVLVEEELEWLSNQDAFPPIEFEINQINQMIDMKPENIITNQSPVSVLGISNSNFRVPVKARSKKRRRRRNFSEFVTQKWWYNVEEPKKKNVGGSRNSTTSSSSFIRRCLHCQADKTPQWRAGPLGPKTLCNACGVRYKSGRLLPEYRPASSPTFSEQVHSNSHRKVLDMRRSKQKDEVFLQPLELDMRRLKQKDEVFLQPLELDMRRSNQKDEVFLQPLEKGYEHKKRVLGQRRISASTTTTLGVKKRVIGQRRVSASTTTTLGVRSCQHCQTKTTPEWREGPLGPRTLCNACGVRYKSGRLFPEYRPANSPSFSGELHSNSHKKVLDMRRQKQSLDEGR